MTSELAIAKTLPPDIREAFNKRWKRVDDCINLRTPDRMPVSVLAAAISTSTLDSSGEGPT